MSPSGIELSSSNTCLSRKGDNINVRGVSLSHSRWRESSIKIPDKYASENSLSPIFHLSSGDVVQLKIKDELKKYAYRVGTYREENSSFNAWDKHTKYTFEPCYKSARTVTVFVPDDVQYTPRCFYGLQEEIPRKELEVYLISDNYILTELGHPELVVSQTI